MKTQYDELLTSSDGVWVPETRPWLGPGEMSTRLASVSGLNAPENKASDTRTGTKIRCTTTQDQLAKHLLSIHGRVSGTHRAGRVIDGSHEVGDTDALGALLTCIPK